MRFLRNVKITGSIPSVIAILAITVAPPKANYSSSKQKLKLKLVLECKGNKNERKLNLDKNYQWNNK